MIKQTFRLVQIYRFSLEEVKVQQGCVEDLPAKGRDGFVFPTCCQGTDGTVVEWGGC